MKKRELYTLLIMLLCMALPMITLAQGPPDPQDTPVDGGLGLLLAAGAAYGVKKYREGRKQQEAEKQG
ncbi:MAG: PID-CTERM protein-sorting domain-containing protein [Ferruginibacter sp.]